jgi:hypothetical protein
MNYRKLTLSEIEQLKSQNCFSQSWEKILVADKFDAQYIRNVIFIGDIKLGFFNELFSFAGGVELHSGIYNTTLFNVEIGNNVYINNVRLYIANYEIGDRVIINNIQSLICTGNSTFGNNTKVSVLNETGGREVPIFNNLSSQLAYCIALYRYNIVAVNKICDMITDYSESLRSSVATIANDAIIINCGEIKNVIIGQSAELDGVSEITEGTVNSTKEEKTYIGCNVIAKHFIISDSATITDGVLIDKCFVGQGCQLGKQYSAENSLFFANCVGMHGEACAIFAGPYTVTHHKSTLLISGMFSFLNAGSGSNQSNHLYKLGPIHQGVVERGCKTSSDSYLLCPYKVGAFSIVLGRHTDHTDTSDMPFSYLIESDNHTILVPGVNIRSVGTIRDAMKWPKRDQRKGEKTDLINYNLLSPYTISKMIKGREILKELRESCGVTSESYPYQGTIIKNSSLHKGLNLYEMAINKFLGNSIIKRLEIVKWESIEQIRERLKPDFGTIGLGDWVDISGLFAPKTEIDKMILSIESGETTSIEQINDALRLIQNNYYDYEWTWVIDKICARLKKSIEEIEISDIVNIVNTWKKSVVDLDQELYRDAKKEYELALKTSFGMDGNHEDKEADFESVRGDFESNDFVKNIISHIETKSELARELLNRINHLIR